MVDLKDGIIVLDGSKTSNEGNHTDDMNGFHRLVGVDSLRANWEILKHKSIGAKGVMIAPYDYMGSTEYLEKNSRGLSLTKFNWFRQWDVPSCCIWDVSCVKEVKDSVLLPSLNGINPPNWKANYGYDHPWEHNGDNSGDDKDSMDEKKSGSDLG